MAGRAILASRQGRYSCATVCGVTTGRVERLPVISMDPEDCIDEPLPAPPWEPLVVGEAICPDWFVYHTNMTGDWEVFRLGELLDDPGADPNLTQGVGPRVYDVAPSRSPDAEWITYASNRDGNWEIYIGRANGTEQRRVTYNTTAIDIDPMWSPDGSWIVTTRRATATGNSTRSTWRRAKKSA